MKATLLAISKPTPFLLRICFWVAIWAHVITGLCTLSFKFPQASRAQKEFYIQKWSIKLLKILGIELRLKNAAILPSRPFLLVSNHISWVDIHAINAFRPIRFVAKSEVEKWPIFGWMAKQLGTVFIKRDSSRHAHFVVGEMCETLKSSSICIFPEGTSTNGETVRPFKSILYESAVIANVPVYSLAIRYISLKSGRRTDIPAFVGDMGLLESMSRILRDRFIAVELTFFSPPGSSPEMPSDRKWLALHSYEQISHYLAANH